MAVSEIPFIQFYPGDYFQKTHSLSHSNHATYLLMLFAAWGSGGTLPNDDKIIASIAKLSKRQWLSEKAVIMQYWTVEGDTICNKRMQKDYTDATEKRQRRVRAGSLGGIAKSLKSNEAAPSNAIAMLHRNSSNAPSKSEPEPYKKENPLTPLKGGRSSNRKRGSKSFEDIAAEMEAENGHDQTDC